MLPFLMENEISSQGNGRAKIRKVADERLLSSDENIVLASGQQHSSVPDNSSQECNRAQVERMEEEDPPKAHGKCVLGDIKPQPAVTKASPPERNAAEAQNVLQQEALTSIQDLLTSSGGDLSSDGDDVQASGQHQIVVSEDSPEECKRDEAERNMQVEAVKSDGRHDLDGTEFQCCVSEVSPLKNTMSEVQKVTQELLPLVGDKENSSDVIHDLDSTEFQCCVSEVSPLKSSMSEVEKVTQEEPLPLVGDKENSNKGDHLANEQLQPCVANESLTTQLQDNAEFAEVQQCQNKNSRYHDVGFVSPTKTVIPSLHQHCAQAPGDSVASLDDQFLDSDIQMMCRPSDPCAVDRSLSVEETSGCIPLTKPGCKAGISPPRGTHSTEKRVLSHQKLSPQKLSPKKLSPKKGILKRHTRGCKGICMCLDCSTFRLRADRAFEFSKKQMHEADDIINNLLKEVANLRSLVENPTGQESTEAACRRASRVEDVARQRCRQMFADLNSHCRIPGPRVRFAQYVSTPQQPER